MRALVVVMYLVLGCLQTFAVFAGLTQWLGLPWLPALLLAPLASYTPVVGTGAAIIGAVHVWGLEPTEAATLFLGPFLFIAVAYAAVVTAGRPDPLSGATRRRRSRAPASRGAAGRP